MLVWESVKTSCCVEFGRKFLDMDPRGPRVRASGYNPTSCLRRRPCLKSSDKGLGYSHVATPIYISQNQQGLEMAGVVAASLDVRVIRALILLLDGGFKESEVGLRAQGLVV